MPPLSSLHRRQFIKTLGAGAFAAPLFTRHLLSAPPSARLRHASFGASGMAWADLQAICGNPFVNLVAVADVDLNRVADVKAMFPDVRVYQDWRDLLDRERDLDSVNISTPDHMHGVMALAAMQRGKHVYCQKPLTNTLHETRALTEFAKSSPLVTQMGIQVHANRAYRQAVALVHGGAIGKVKEVHLWSYKSYGGKGPPPVAGEPVPQGLAWDLWLGPCTARPYVGDEYYHPTGWRRRVDFGTGTFGDMGCHMFDPVFEALALTAPLTVRAEGEAPDRWNWSANATVRYVFPGTRHTEGDTVSLTWYDGEQRPPDEIFELIKEPAAPELTASASRRRRKPAPLEEGSVIVGTKGVLHVPHVDTPRLHPADQFADYPMPEVKSSHHWSDWAEACVGQGGKPLAPFSYSGPLTEAVLLGTIAVRFPRTMLRWNSAKLRFDNESAANAFVGREYRHGWKFGSV